MTSPAQLKYLDAIGIPVWVSREHVRLDIETETPVTDTSPEHAGSVEEILNGLEQKFEAPIRENFKVEPADHSKPSTEDVAKGFEDASSIQEGELPNEIARTQQHLVFAKGNPNADWMVIGESPELNEAHDMQPFALQSGRLIDQMLRSVMVGNPQVEAHIINVIKHSFSSSQQASSELNQFLVDKIQQVSPKMIIIVGQLSAQNLLQTSEPLARLRSKAHQLPGIDIPAVVTYYPTHLLSKPLDKRKAWNDLKLAMTLLN